MRDKLIPLRFNDLFSCYARDKFGDDAFWRYSGGHALAP
jgi:hypothetical protein